MIHVKSTIATILMLLLFGTSFLAQTKKEVTKAEATEKFIEYVMEKSYAGDFERKPFDVSRGNRYFKDGWSAFFRYKRPCRKCHRNRGHLYYMDAYGENLTDEHQDVVFVGWKGKRKRAR